MSGPYDATGKDLIELYPPDWLPLADLHTSAPIDVIDADIATVSGAADKVLRVGESPPWLAHFELQSSHKSDLPERAHWYNALLRHRHGLPVRTVIVLLRPEANSPSLNGVFEQGFPGETPYDVFRYRVVRVWQIPVQTLLTGGLGTLPLAPLGAVDEADLPNVVRQIDERLLRETNPEQAGVLGTAAFILTGLRLPPDKIIDLYRGVHFMSILKDSSAYQVFLEEGALKGALKEAHRFLLLQGHERFGPPDEATAKTLEAIEDLQRLERMGQRLVKVASWQEVLATP